jgi:WD40 repeat protein
MRSSSAVTTRFYDFDIIGPEYKFIGHTNTVNQLAITGDVLWSAGSDYRICKWRVSPTPREAFFGSCGTVEPDMSIKAHPRRVTALAPINWSILSSGGQDGKLKLWSDDLSPQGAVTAHSGSVQALELISEHALLSGGSDGLIKVWDVETLSTVRTTLRHHRAGVNTLKAHSDSTFISGGADGMLCIWDLRSPHLVNCFEKMQAEVNATCVWDTYCVYTGGLEPRIKVGHT